jgi:hypothetical protein
MGCLQVSSHTHGSDGFRSKKLQKGLQNKYNVTIGYDTVWKGKEKALADMYDTWEEFF